MYDTMSSKVKTTARVVADIEMKRVLLHMYHSYAAVHLVHLLAPSMNECWKLSFSGSLTCSYSAFRLPADYVKGFGGKFGVQTDRQDKSALGWDHQEKLQLHESQKGTADALVVYTVS